MERLLSRLESGFPAEQVIGRGSGQCLTAGQAVNRCTDLADELCGRGTRRVALYGDNSLDWMIADLACQAAGACLVPLPTFFSARQLQHVLARTTPDVVLCTGAETLAPLLAGPVQQQCNAPGTAYRMMMMGSVSDAEVPPGTNKITFTSGSTGDPKGVCLNTPQLLRQAHALVTAAGLNEPRHLCLLPLSTLLENVAGIYAPLMAGGEVVIPSLGEIGFEGSSLLDTRSFVRVIDRYEPASIILTPQLLTVLLAAATAGWKPPASLKFAAVGGGRVSTAVVERAHALGIPAFEGYGLSECASVVSLNTPAEYDHNTSGRPLPHLGVEIDDDEIVVSGSSMLGYLGEPDSWGLSRIRTGDLGSIDERGYLSIEGRRKNVLVSSFGRNISPEWVESELAACVGLAECVVFGDERPYCVALLSPLEPDRSDASIQGAINAANAGLPDYARIRGWHRLQTPLAADETLITTNGRPRREAIAAQFQPVIDSLYPVHTRTCCA